MPIIKPMIKFRLFSKVYLIMYMLFSEHMVSEQAKLYAHAQGLSGPRYWTWVDFTRRVSTKGVLRVYETLFGKVAQKMALSLQMGDERVVAHKD
ncbi:MAG: hypothetical protein GY711_07280 [bacterium]|nr:hypothetical protein [bacterium]